MKNRSKHVKQNRLIEQLKRRLFLSAGLFFLVIMVLASLSLLTTSAQYKLSEQKVAIRVNLDGMLNSMIDQESGLRGYITTNDPRFLEPFNSGRPQYLAYVRNLKNLMQSRVFSEATSALAQADAQAEDWYNHFALLQI